MKRFIFYFSFLMICSCTCDSGSKVDETPTTGYNVTFPDGKQNSVDLPESKTKKSPPSSVSVQQPATNNVASKANNPKNPNMANSGQAGSLMTPEQAAQARKGKTAGVGEKMAPPKVPAKQGNRTALDNVLPTACDLIDVQWLAKTMSIGENISKTNSSSSRNPNVNSCFFKWPNGLIANSGIFLQLSENPLPEEVTDYATYFIKGKLEGGEMDMHGENYKYIPYDHIGTAGAYCAEQGKYFWQISPERVFMLAFNTGNSASKEKRWADAISTHVMEAYANKQQMTDY